MEGWRLVVRYAVSQEDIGKAEEDFRAGMSLYELVLGALLAALSSPGIRERQSHPRAAARLFGAALRCCPWRPVGRGSIYLCKFGMAGFCTDTWEAHDQAKARAARAVSLEPGNSAGMVLADLFGENSRL
jgi:hypothetical protein